MADFTDPLARLAEPPEPVLQILSDLAVAARPMTARTEEIC